MGVILGIDIGGSSTKIVGLRPDLSVIDMPVSYTHLTLPTIA